MVVKFKVELGDLIAVQTDVVDTAKFHKRNNFTLSIVSVVLLIIINMTIIKVDLIVIMMAAIGLFFINNKVVYKKAMIFQTKKIAKDNPLVLPGDCTLTISEKGIFREFQNSSQNIEWNQIKLAKEDAERYLLYISDIQVIVIKKHPHNLSNEDVLKYNELVRKYLSEQV